MMTSIYFVFHGNVSNISNVQKIKAIRLLSMLLLIIKENANLKSLFYVLGSSQMISELI